MKPYAKLTKEERKTEYAALRAQYDAFCAKGLKLNMARGKPGDEQLALVSGIFDLMIRPENYISDGTDVRNYGELRGMPAAHRLFAEILDCKPEQIFVGGNSSLQLMYDLVSKGYTHGLKNSPRPWCREEKLRWLCPAPGYDRHFKITESFGFELITIPMTEDGPDMDTVEKYVKDPSVKGIWCVPKYSNPDGIIYSDETIRRFAALRPAAPDFALVWDNAYAVHEFEGDYVPFPDILSLCEAEGNADMVYEFASTSKITMPGGGVAVLAASEANLDYLCSLIGVQIISYDKINQQRHALFLKDKAHTLELMKKHAAVIGKRFKVVLDTLDREIAPLEIATWNRPTGGYFVSLFAMPGTAKRTHQLLKDAGVTLTGAGATYPYGKDPADSNLRIAPSYPPVDELQQAMNAMCLCLRMAALEQLGL